MNNKLAQAVVLALGVSLISACDDSNDGTAGIDGQTGVTGATGATGATGLPGSGVRLNMIGRYESGLFDEGGAEIVTYDASTQSVFVVNSGANTVDQLDISSPNNPVKVATLDVTQDFAAAKGANSLAVHNGVLAVAVQNDAVDGNGKALFYSTADLSFLNSVDVGVLPDMITFTPDGNYVLTANEGEPSDDYKIDPEGSVSVIDISSGVASADVNNAGFGSFDAATLVAAGVRLFGPNADNPAKDLEPEYIAISADSATAYVALQENNAFAIVDIANSSVSEIKSLGFKDHNREGYGLDADKNDKAANIQPLQIFGMYQPDSIAAYEFNGKTYIVSANEGDAREYIADAADEASCLADGGLEFDKGECLYYTDETKLEDLALDPAVFSAEQIAAFGDGKGLGDLGVTSTLGNTDADPEYEEIYAYGARSFSIWDAEGNQVWDSGDMMEQITAQMFPAYFNSTDNANSVDNRSDNKGPEPEGVVVGEVAGRTYAFVGLERMGGVMVFDVSNPFGAQFIDYFNYRDFSVDIDEIDAGNLPAGAAGDLAPEGMDFISAEESPNGLALLVVGNEVSGTTTIYQLQ